MRTFLSTCFLMIVVTASAENLLANNDFSELKIVITASEENLLANSDFSALNEHGQPENWGISHPTHLERNSVAVKMDQERIGGASRPFLTIEKTEGVENVAVGNQDFSFPAGTQAIRIRTRMRGRNLTEGTKFWHVAGIGLTFLFEHDTPKSGDMSKWIKLPAGNSDWTEYESIIPVREGATRASIAIVSQGWTGALDVQWIRAEAVQ